MYRIATASLLFAALLMGLWSLSAVAGNTAPNRSVTPIPGYGQSPMAHSLTKPADGPLVMYERYYNYLEGEYHLQSQTVYTYDGMDRPTEILEQLFSAGDSTWDNSDRTLNTWNGSEIYPVEALSQSWNQTEWYDYGRSMFTLDELGRAEEMISQTYNDPDWSNAARQMHTFDNGGLIPMETYTYAWYQDDWLPTSLAENTVSDGLLQESVYSYYSGGSYEEQSRSLYTYDQMDRLEVLLSQNKAGSDWSDYQQTVNTYEGDYLVTTQIDLNFGFGWMPQSRTSFTYNGDGSNHETFYESYSEFAAAGTAAWVPTGKTEYLYEAASVQELEGYPLPDQFTLEQNYPNPFNPTTQIRFALTKPGYVKLEVFDLLGRKVTTLVDQQLGISTHQADFDATGLASGIYFYRLQTDTVAQTRKMLLVK